MSSQSSCFEKCTYSYHSSPSVDSFSCFFSLSYFRTFKAKSSSRLAILNIKGTIFLSLVGCEKRCGTIYFPVTVVKYILPEA